MSRQKTPEPYIQQKISLPATLMARFAMLHWDPVLTKVRYGAVSEIVTLLLTDYVSRMEAQQASAPSLDPTKQGEARA